MMKNFIEELRWRGMLHDVMPGAETLLMSERTTAYVGIDPTADSLHIGHLVSVMMLRHLQECGHRPLVVVGGATGMIGDPSMKSAERTLLDEATLRYNEAAIGRQLARFLDFDAASATGAVLLNNYDWMRKYSFLSFVRDIGKHITVNYMMSKESVRKRLTGEAREGLSFTEFTYQLLQGYDFLYLYRTHGCRLQMGGSDQWGNMTTGVELIRRTSGAAAFALTCPLITKADGGKFGKTESGNVWLDPRRTSPYAFYQFWLNTGDDDALRYLKIFTLLERPEIERLAAEHARAPHERALQKRLARELTCMVHSEADYTAAVEASSLLFGNAASDVLRALDEPTFLAVFDGVPRFEVPAGRLPAGVVELLAVETPVFPSKGECRKMIQGGGLSLNREKITDPARTVSAADALNGRYLLVQKGKKQYFILYIR
jgi:tyrosyl-tRNA synthetase